MALELQTRNVFLDTSIFIQLNFGFHARKLQSLVSMAKRGNVSILLTDITVWEVEANLKSRIDSAEQAFETFQQKSYILKSADREETRDLYGGRLLDFAAVRESLTAQWQSFLDEGKVEVISTENTSSRTIFEAYLSGKSPFDRAKKKTEFPDAFALQALNDWCTDHNETVYVVSLDGDMAGVCEGKDSLIYVDKLDELLDALLRADGQIQKFLYLYRREKDFVLNRIADAFEAETIAVQQDEVYLVSQDVDQVFVRRESVTDIEEDWAVMELLVEVMFQATLAYLAPLEDEYSRPGDAESPVVGTLNVTQNRILTAPAEVVFQFAEYNLQTINVETIVFNNGKPLVIDADDYNYEDSEPL